MAYGQLRRDLKQELGIGELHKLQIKWLNQKNRVI